MKKVSRAYKQAMNKHLRDHSYMIVTVGIINNEAQASAKVNSQSFYLSNNKGLFRDAEVQNTYATFEDGLFKLDGSMILAPEETGFEQLANNTSFISENIRGSLVVEFDNSYDIKGLTIDFGEFYPTEFTVNGTTYNNDSEVFTCTDSFNAISSLTITPVHFTGGDNKRLRINSIRMGIGIVFQNEDIETASFAESASFISEELPQMDFNITCFDKYQRFRVDDSNSFINYLETGQEIAASIGIELEDGSVEYVRLPLTYLSSWSSNNEKIAFTSVDRFAFLTGKYTGGNTIHSRTLYDDAIAVLTDAGLEPDEYDVTDILRGINVVNPLPEVSYAECLQLIANAGRCLLKQNESGMITLTPNFENIMEPEDLQIVSDSHAPWSIPDNIKQGSDVVYADFSYFLLDGSLTLVPADMREAKGSGYVSEQISSGNCYFYENLLGVTEPISIRSSSDRYLHDIVSNMPLTSGQYILSGAPRDDYFNYTETGDINVELHCDLSNGADYVITWDTPYVAFNVPSDMTCSVYYTFINTEGEPIGTISNLAPSLIKENEEDEDGNTISEIDDPDGDLEQIDYIGNRPSINIVLPTQYTYYGINLKFTYAIDSFAITTYRNDTKIDYLFVRSEDEGKKLYEVVHEFQSFDRMKIDFIKTSSSFERVVLEQISFGDLSEYKVKNEDMLEKPVGTVESKTQSVSVRVFTFQNGQNGEQPQALDDNVFESYIVNSTGENITFENQLISTQAHAQMIAEWIANYYGNNVIYDVTYRGEPRIEAADYLFLDSEILSNLQVEVESHVINFNGALSGQLSLRRANNIIHS